MKRNKRTLIRRTLFLLFFLTLISYCCTLPSSSGLDSSMFLSILVNFVFFFLICFFCFRWKKIFFKPIMRIMADLDNFKSFIEVAKNSEDCDSTLDYMRSNYEECFKTSYIREGFNKYLNELELLDVESADEYNNCDISDFINYEDVCVDVNRVSADNIAASMTGLGILGTFVGLAIGLQFFNASDASAMADSIVPLIDGIKTAFYTSIYGVVVSLVLNYQLKKRLNELEVCLNDFYNNYYENVMAYPEYMLEKQSFDIQAEQKEILSSFAESVSVSLSREMKDMMVPIFDKFSESIENFSKTIAVNQVEGLEKIVDNFISNMNEALGNQFDNLGNTIKDTCEWQQKSVAAMESVITHIITEADKIKELNDDLAETVDRFDGYLGKLIHQENNLIAHMEEYEKTIDTTFESLCNVCDKLEDIVGNEKQMVEANMQITDLFKENNQLVIESQEKVKENIEVLISGMKVSVDELVNHTKEEFENIGVTVGNILIATTEHSAEVFDESCQMLDDTHKQVRENVNVFTTGIRESINKMIEYTDEKFGILKATLKNINDEISGSASDLSDVYVKLQEDTDTSLERTFGQFDKELANMTSYFSSALVDISYNTEKLPRIVNETYNQLKKQTGAYIEAITELESEVKDAVTNISEMNGLLEANLVAENEKKNKLSGVPKMKEMSGINFITEEKAGE